MEKFPLDALSNGWSASVCVRIFPGSRLQVIPSPSKLSRPPPPPQPQKKFDSAGKNINERICGKKRKVNESGGPPSANGPWKGRRPKAFGVGLWGKVWGEACRLRESGRGRWAWTPALFPARCYLPGASILWAQRMNVSGHLRVYLYSVCDAKSRTRGGEEEGV